MQGADHRLALPPFIYLVDFQRVHRELLLSPNSR